MHLLVFSWCPLRGARSLILDRKNSHDFARILENNSIFGQNLQKIKNTRTNKIAPMNGRFLKFSELSLKIKSEKNFLQSVLSCTTIRVFTNPQLITEV